MKLLLTDAGVTNSSIHNALLELLGKPIAECNALCIPTAGYGHPMSNPGKAYSFIAGTEPRNPMTNLGWKSVGVLELTALPSLEKERWSSWVRAADVLLVNGGDALYLAHWMRESDLLELIKTLPNLVWVGLSAGSMVMTPRIGEEFVQWKPPTGGDETLGLVDFCIFPHVPMNTLEEADVWAAKIGLPAYAIDSGTALKVVDGNVEVVSEGEWKRLNVAGANAS